MKKFSLVCLCILFACQGNAGVVSDIKRASIFGIGVSVFLSSKNKGKKVDRSQPRIAIDENSFSQNLYDEEDDFQISLRVNNTKILRKNLNASIRMATPAGYPPPEDPEGCEAHHIVPQAEERQWAKPYTDVAKEALNNCIDIDDEQNGIYLPSKSNASCVGSNHKNIHTKAYYQDISSRLSAANSIDGCNGVKDELQLIKKELSMGRIW